MKALPLRFVVAAALMAATAIVLQAHSRGEYFPPRQSLASLPMHLGSWTSQEYSLDQQTLDILGPGEFLLREYTDTDRPGAPIGVFIAYFPSQKAGDTIHSPNHCLPGAGWVPTVRQLVQIPRPDGTSFPANRYVVAKQGNRQLVLYWFQAHGREVASEYWAKYYLVADSIRMNRSDGALVRLISPMYQGETVDAAQARVMTIGSQLIPLLDNYVPQ